MSLKKVWYMEGKVGVGSEDNKNKEVNSEIIKECLEGIGGMTML